ncbi:MAG: Ca-activated chloride channel [Blastocatellia bacterium]|nr:Ca-activated chloride channel [Blastocatellia bacterium]
MSLSLLKSIPLRCFLLAMVSMMAACPGHAQDKEPVDVIKVSTELVVFDAQVIDKKSKRIIGDLSKDDFEIYEKGARQQVSYFSRDELPLSIMLLLDVSGSVRPILHQIRDGALRALQRLKANDQVAVMAFASKSELSLDFTGDRKLVSQTIEAVTASERLGSGTFLGPALDEAATHMQTAPTASSRRVIIIITDNIATSFGMEKRIEEKLLDSGTVVYGLIVRGAIGKVFNIVSLGQIKAVDTYVKETGGEIFGASKNEVDAKLGMVIDRLRARYAIGFRPANEAAAEEFRPVEIRLKPVPKRKEKPVVLTKRGYYLRRR